MRRAQVLAHAASAMVKRALSEGSCGGRGGHVPQARVRGSLRLPLLLVWLLLLLLVVLVLLLLPPRLM